MTFQPLSYIYEGTGDPKAATLLLLHGTGGTERDLIPLAHNLVQGYNILSVRGNVLEGGMPRFFKRKSVGVLDEIDLEFRTHELVSFLMDVAIKESFDPTLIIALGFSNGANIAGAVLALYPDLLAGAILFRPMQPFVTMPDNASKRRSPVLISAGTYDNMVSLNAIEAYKYLLEHNKFKVFLYKVDTGHNLLKADVLLAKKWLENITMP